MTDRLADAAREAAQSFTGEYLEIRVEERIHTTIRQAGTSPAEYSPFRETGAFVRVVERGVTGSAYTSDSDPSKAVSAAASMASAPGTRGSTRLALERPVTGSFSPPSAEPPGEVPAREKAFLCRRYCELLAASSPGASSRVVYREVTRRKTVVTSAGTDVTEHETLCGYRFDLSGSRRIPVTRDTAWRGGFSPFRSCEDIVQEMAQELSEMERSSSIGRTRARVVLDPEMTGAFVHEVFGHLSEPGSRGFRYGSCANASIPEASACVSVADDSTHFDMPGSCAFDDEGVPGSRKLLVSNGMFTGAMHSLETAGRCGARSSGNARALDIRSSPEPRMTCTYLLPGTLKKEDLLAMASDGLLLYGALTGSTDMECFSITSRGGYVIRNGVLTTRLGPVSVSGRVSDMLGSVLEVADDLRLCSGTGGCSRAGQGYLPVSYGGPHVLLGEVDCRDA